MSCDSVFGRHRVHVKSAKLASVHKISYQREVAFVLQETIHKNYQLTRLAAV